MSIVRRVKDISMATLNEMLEKNEDPVRIIDQHLDEQKKNLHELEQLYREQLKHSDRIRRQVLDAEQMVEKREQQAALAIRAGEEDIARMALEDKLAHEEKRNQYKSLYMQGKEMIIDLEERIGELKHDIQEVTEKRRYYLDRMESIQLQRKINERKYRVRSDTGTWFDRLEHFLNDMEMEATAFRDMVLERRTDRPATSSWSKHDAIDLEMEKLRKKLDEQKRGESS